MYFILIWYFENFFFFFLYLNVQSSFRKKVIKPVIGGQYFFLGLIQYRDIIPYTVIKDSAIIVMKI